MDELAFKSLEYDECLLNRANNELDLDAFVNSVQDKLFRMQVDYTKRIKIQEICYKKKSSDLQRTIKDLKRQMEVRNIRIHYFNQIEIHLGHFRIIRRRRMTKIAQTRH